MSNSYSIAVELGQPLAAAIDTLRAALTAEQMGIVSEVDVQATLKSKLGIDSHPQKLLGICSPKAAHSVMTAEPDFASLLPCGCSAAETTPGRTRITLQDPRMLIALSANPAIRDTLETVHAALARVVDALRHAS